MLGGAARRGDCVGAAPVPTGRFRSRAGQAANGGGLAVLASTGEHIAAPHADSLFEDAGGSPGGRMLFSSSQE
jgi:hypothetical protein